MLKIVHEDTDPLCTRISMGGTKELGYYMVYRGKLKDVRDILIEVLNQTSGFTERPVGATTLLEK